MDILSIFMVLSCAFIVIFATKSKSNNKNIFIWIVHVVGIVMVYTSFAVYMSKFGYYEHSGALGDWIFFSMSSSRLGVSDLSNISNFGFLLQLLALLLTGACASNYRKLMYVLLLPLIFFAVTVSANFAEYIYTEIYPAYDYSFDDLVRLYNKVKSINVYLVILYPLAIMLLCLFNMLKTKIYFVKKYSVMDILQLCLYALYNLYQIFGIMGEFTFKGVNILLIPQQTDNAINPKDVLLVMALYIILSSLLFMNNEIKNSLNYKIKRKTFVYDREVFEKELRMLLHGHKNYYYTIYSLAEQIEEEPEFMQKNISMIKNMAHEKMTNISDDIEQLKHIKTNMKTVNIAECIKRATAKNTIRFKNVKYKFEFYKKEYIINGDSELLENAFLNIFNNSAEAILEKSEDAGLICVSIESEDNYAIITIRDNGCGISKKNIKNIFKPVYSTKNSVDNWGVGLNYVYKIISAHGGKIFVKSKENEYTLLQITLPSCGENSQNSKRSFRRQMS